MENIKPFGNRADAQLIGDTVGEQEPPDPP